MKNWSTDIKQFNKKSDEYRIWRLEQLINYGLDGEKLNSREVKKYWKRIDIDSDAREFLSLLLWPKK